jgi:hypothetical protein
MKPTALSQNQQLIHQQQLGIWLSAGTNYNQLINIGYSRPLDNRGAGQHFLDHTLILADGKIPDPVSRNNSETLLNPAPGATADDLAAPGFNIIDAAHSPKDNPYLRRHTFPPSSFIAPA